MRIEIENTSIRDAYFVRPEIFNDERGFFTEIYREDIWRERGAHTGYVQLNHSGSARNVVRGLHFQWDPPMGKLMRVIHGTAFLVAVDIRKGSPTLGQWIGREVRGEKPELLFAPEGFARGFAVNSSFAEIEYLTTGIYNEEGESGILWNDPDIGIPWPTGSPIVSERDKNAMTFREWLKTPESDNFIYQER